MLQREKLQLSDNELSTVEVVMKNIQINIDKLQIHEYVLFIYINTLVYLQLVCLTVGYCI